MSENNHKREIWPWLVAGAMVLVLVGVLLSVIVSLASAYADLSAYVTLLEGNAYYPDFIDPEDLLYV